MQLVVNDLLTHYSKTGKGPVIVLLHGWGDSIATFKAIESSLKNSYTVVSIDLPGFGATSPPKRPFTLADYADFVSSVLKKIECEKVYAFLGHSNGGSIAIKGLSTQKFSANKLILLGSAGIRSKNSIKQNIFKITAKLVKLPLYLLPKTTRDKARKKIYGLIGSDLFVAEGMQDTFKNIVSEDLVSSAGSLSLPIFLLYGSEDTATPPSFGEIYKQAMKNAELKVIKGAGHFVHLDEPQLINKHVLEFLSR